MENQLHVKFLAHVLKKNNYKVLIGGNIGKPVLDLKIKKKTFFNY